MKWQLLLVGLLLLACVGSVGAVRENFQSWGSNSIYVVGDQPYPITLLDSTKGTLMPIYTTSTGGTQYLINIDPIIWNYAAFDLQYGHLGWGIYANLLDSSGNLIQRITVAPSWCFRPI